MSFTIDGTSSSAYNVKLKSDYQEPGSPEVRRKELEVPGRAGRYDFGSEYDTRTLELPLVTLDTSTQSEVQEVIRDFVDALTDNNGEPKEVKLSFGKESDKHYKVKLDQSFGVRRYPGNLADFRVRLRATEPFAFTSTNTTSVNITSSGQAFQVTNSGSAPTPVVITIENTGTSTVDGFTIQKS